MKTLTFNNDEYKAERIVKNNDSIIGYIGDDTVFKFNGISDFSGFTLAENQEFDEQEITLEQQITANTDYLLDVDLRLMIVELGIL